MQRQGGEVQLYNTQPLAGEFRAFHESLQRLPIRPTPLGANSSPSAGALANIRPRCAVGRIRRRDAALAGCLCGFRSILVIREMMPNNSVWLVRQITDYRSDDFHLTVEWTDDSASRGRIISDLFIFPDFLFTRFPLLLAYQFRLEYLQSP
ncbi:hypothetical protein P170DRAFT_154547 [Aspergillus steynii IBT 23096]|uniref:Uncharacterized protein n=1 Tax=Aspergillus steynii IBT 23096 TaxID=1392250 RepID=A0A2I2GD05_9EURO|nr:uncharacterized protein P170DRAFT_154547 [Aspergillus steynii IBT 23096]PLB50768.1 hypothetical protein P170DRAFT_154547 [Aspergillus steynii IBT 23096]